MKLTASGVTFSAAMTRSPSFSRFSSSTSTIIRPARSSSRASSIVQKASRFNGMFNIVSCLTINAGSARICAVNNSDKKAPLAKRRVGLWLIGACGGIGGTVALGVEALRRGLIGATSVTTDLPAFKHLDLDDFASFVLGGHDIRRSSFRQAVQEMHDRAGVFDSQLIEPCLPVLDEWTANIRPG